MEFFPLVNGKKLPELYRVGFTGTDLEVIISATGWSRLVELTGMDTPFAVKRGRAYVPPLLQGGNFGFYACARATKTLSENICIEIPMLPSGNNVDVSRNLNVYARTLELLLFTLGMILGEMDKQGKEVKDEPQQLFLLGTYLSLGSSHAAALDLSVSPQARRYFEHMGETRLTGTITLMRQHYDGLFPNDKSVSRHSFTAFDVYTRKRGVIHMHTLGNCACLGAMPKNFTDNEGYYLSSHNVDTVYQQFNLLVGIAHIWQMASNGACT